MQNIMAKYQKYDNYDAINVNSLKDIPKDYDGVMGVPITILERFNPEQFEIVGYANGSDDFEFKPIKKYVNQKQISPDGRVSNGSKVNTAPVLKVKRPPNKTYYVAEGVEGYLLTLYGRVFIRRVR